MHLFILNLRTDDGFVAVAAYTHAPTNGEVGRRIGEYISDALEEGEVFPVQGWAIDEVYVLDVCECGHGRADHTENQKSRFVATDSGATRPPIECDFEQCECSDYDEVAS